MIHLSKHRFLVSILQNTSPGLVLGRAPRLIREKEGKGDILGLLLMLMMGIGMDDDADDDDTGVGIKNGWLTLVVLWIQSNLQVGCRKKKRREGRKGRRKISR